MKNCGSNQTTDMLDLQELCAKFNIIPCGVIHVGVHEEKEIAGCWQMGVQKNRQFPPDFREKKHDF